jgi:hypothetical protein
MDHAVTIGADERQISLLSFRARREQFKRGCVVGLNEAVAALAVPGAEVKAAPFARETAVLSERARFSIADHGAISLAKCMKPGEHCSFATPLAIDRRHDLRWWVRR